VTAFAVAAELATVHVILAMACTTGPVDDLVGLERHVVAGLATHARVRSLKSKIRVLVVIKGPGVPGERVVTALARATEVTFVHIIVRVAGIALCRRILEDLRLVTGVAGGLGMRTEQGEACKPMIERDLLLPGAFVVALSALPALVPTVDVVVLVTGIALAGQRNVVDRFHMACLAFERAVSAAQRIARIPVVIEGDLRPLRDRMAAFTLRAVVPPVLVIVAMAAVAIPRELVVPWIGRMAAIAREPRVRTLERKSRVARVVER